MKDYIVITGIVRGGYYSLINNKNEKVKTYTFSYESKPLCLHGKVIKKREFLSDKTEGEVKQEIEKVFYKEFQKMLDNKIVNTHNKKSLYDYKLDIQFNIEKASEQSADWCIKNLTVSELILMGLTVIKG